MKKHILSNFCVMKDNINNSILGGTWETRSKETSDPDMFIALATTKPRPTRSTESIEVSDPDMFVAHTAQMSKPTKLTEARETSDPDGFVNIGF